MSNERLTLYDYVMAGYPAIVCRTSEERRAIESCSTIAKAISEIRIKEDGNERNLICKLACWSETRGIYDEGDNKKTNNKEFSFSYNQDNYSDVLAKGLNLSKDLDKLIFCLLDFHPYIKNPRVIRAAKDAFMEAKKRKVTYIFISENFEVPEELKREMAVFDMDLPSESDFEKLIRETLKVNKGAYGNITEDDIKRAASALSGLNRNQAEDALATSLLKTNRLDLDVIYDIKRSAICNNGLLEYYRSKESMDNVGGMEVFKQYARERNLSAYTEEAKQYGLPYPKGVLLFGVPGCGKSLAAKALANMWKVPLIKLDLSRLFGSLVGETEANTRAALQTAEKMAPCVVWLDEVEKAISGTSSSGRTDSGVTSRMFGNILTWLQEKESPVYVVATANSIDLPPEFLRKGRFDEIFFVDLPNLEERKEILKIQIRKHNRNFVDFNIDYLAEKCDGYNGAEIEEGIVSAMFRAWNDDKRDYTTADIEEAFDEITPASKGVMKEPIENLRKWSQTHGIRIANGSEAVSTGTGFTRIGIQRVAN